MKVARVGHWDDEKEMELADEIKFLKSLDSEFIVQIRSFSWQDKRLCVVSDYVLGK